MSCDDVGLESLWEIHDLSTSPLKPSYLNQDRSILKYVGQIDPTCDVHKRGVWSGNGRGSDVTSTKA